MMTWFAIFLGVFLDPFKPVMCWLLIWTALKASSSFAVRAVGLILAFVMSLLLAAIISAAIGSSFPAISLFATFVWFVVLAALMLRRQSRLDTEAAALPQFTADEMKKARNPGKPWLRSDG